MNDPPLARIGRAYAEALLSGELWQRQEITVAEEHIATEISIRVLALQREAVRLADERPEHLGDARGAVPRSSRRCRLPRTSSTAAA
jgi:hypothetical protein